MQTCKHTHIRGQGPGLIAAKLSQPVRLKRWSDWELPTFWLTENSVSWYILWWYYCDKDIKVSVQVQAKTVRLINQKMVDRCFPKLKTTSWCVSKCLIFTMLIRNMKMMFSEENKVPRTLLEAGKVAGSATYKHSRAVKYYLVLYGHFVHSVTKIKTVCLLSLFRHKKKKIRSVQLDLSFFPRTAQCSFKNITPY